MEDWGYPDQKKTKKKHLLFVSTAGHWSGRDARGVGAAEGLSVVDGRTVAWMGHCGPGGRSPGGRPTGFAEWGFSRFGAKKRRGRSGLEPLGRNLKPKIKECRRRFGFCAIFQKTEIESELVFTRLVAKISDPKKIKPHRQPMKTIQKLLKWVREIHEMCEVMIWKENRKIAEETRFKPPGGKNHNYSRLKMCPPPPPASTPGNEGEE